MPKNTITIITLEGDDKVNAEKKKWQQNSVKNISFTHAVVRSRKDNLFSSFAIPHYVLNSHKILK